MSTPIRFPIERRQSGLHMGMLATIASLGLLFAYATHAQNSGLKAQRATPFLTLQDANHPVISGDGRFVAVAPENGVVVVYLVPSKRKVAVIRKEGAFRHWLSNDGSRLAIAEPQGISIWEIETKQVVAEFKGGLDIGRRQQVKPVIRLGEFSSNLSLAADIVDLFYYRKREDNPVPGVGLWDMESGRLLRTFGTAEFPKQQWGSVKLSPDGRLLAASRSSADMSGAQGAQTVVWDTTTGRELLNLPYNSAWVDLSHDNSRLALRPDLKPRESFWPAEVWEITSGRLVSRIGIKPYRIGTKEHTTPPPMVAGALSPDGKLLATATVEYLLLWDTESGELLAAQPHEDRWPPEERIKSVVFSGDGRYLVTGSYWTEVVKVWSVGQVLERAAVRTRQAKNQ